jgi:hypothetical protein
MAGGGQNVFQQSAQGMQNAGAAAQGAAGYQPMMVGPQNLSGYMNPFQQDVIDRSMNTLQNQQLQQQNTMDAQASAAGAFGGSRHGVANAQTNAAFADTRANTIAGLNSANFGQAQQASMGAQMANQNAGLQGAGQRLNAAGTLGNLSNLGFGMGMGINNQQAQQGAQQQGLNQQLINAGKGQYGGFTGAPQQSLQTLFGALQGTPYGQNQTQSTQPGLFDFLSLGLSL